MSFFYVVFQSLQELRNSLQEMLQNPPANVTGSHFDEQGNQLNDTFKSKRTICRNLIEKVT